MTYYNESLTLSSIVNDPKNREWYTLDKGISVWEYISAYAGNNWRDIRATKNNHLDLVKDYNKLLEWI